MIERESGLSCEELYDRFCEGDSYAFEEIVENYKDSLFSFIRGIVGDYHEAEYLIIETFAQLALSETKFAGRSSLKTYIFTIGRNLALKHVKMLKREAYVSYDDVMHTLVDSNNTPERAMIQNENNRALYTAMESLKNEYRTVLELIYLEDMSYMEAADTMNKSIDQIGDLVYRAKTALRKKLKQMNFS